MSTSTSDNASLSLLADQILKQEILRSFQCPFLYNTTKNKCPHRSQPSYCPFGHPEMVFGGGGGGVGQLKLPSFICIDDLLGQCVAPTKIVHKNSFATDTPKTRGVAKIVALFGCTTGIHVDPLVDLIDLDTFQAKYANLIAQYFDDDNDYDDDDQQDGDGDGDNEQIHVRMPLKCGICREKIREHYGRRLRQFALLENCDHCFCACCIRKRQQQQQQQQQQSSSTTRVKNEISCPLCNVISARYLISDRFISTKNDGGKVKKLLFSSYRCVCNNNNNNNSS